MTARARAAAPFLAGLAAVALLAACAAPERPRPLAGLTVTVRVMPPEWIAAAAAKPGSRVGSRNAAAFFDYDTCTAYLPAGTTQAAFVAYLAHEIGRHALGEQHDGDGRWLDAPPALADAMQRLCVR